MRGGTSKGPFFHERDLPSALSMRSERDRILLAAMGSPDPYGGQIDGMGCATPSPALDRLLPRWPHPSPELWCRGV